MPIDLNFLVHRDRLRISGDTKYETNPCIFKRGNALWCFFVRADSISSRVGNNVESELYRVYFTKSFDDGKTWDSPVIIGSARPANHNHQIVSALMDGNDILRVYVSTGLAGTDRKIYQYVSLDLGASWSDATEVTGFNNVEKAHFFYKYGKIHCVFDTTGTGEVKYCYSTDGSTFTTPVQIAASGHYAPKFYLRSNGELIVATAKTAAGEIWFHLSNDNGATWSSKAVAGSTVANEENSPSICELPDSSIIIFWDSKQGTDSKQVRAIKSTDDGANWIDERPITAGDYGANEWWDTAPSICIDADMVHMTMQMEQNLTGTGSGNGNIWYKKFTSVPKIESLSTAGGSVADNAIKNNVTDINSRIGDAESIKGVDVDDSAIGADKVLRYKTGSGKLEYDSVIGGGSTMCWFFPVDHDSNYGEYRVQSISGTGSFRFTFFIPHCLSVITHVHMICIVTASAAQAGRDIDLYSNYGADGELYNQNTEQDITSTYDLSAYPEKFHEFDIAHVFSSIAAGDRCGIRVDHKSIGGYIRYLGIKVEGTI